MQFDSWFDSPRTRQPRTTDGRYSHKQGTAPEISLNETPAGYGATGRDVLRYAVLRHGVRWRTLEERQHVIDEHTAEFAVAVIASHTHSYVRHPHDEMHQRWCAERRRTIPELANVLLHEEDPGFFMTVLSRPDIPSEMAHFSAHHLDADVARRAIHHENISMQALVAVRNRYRRRTEQALARHRAEPWPPAQEHWAWLAERESVTASMAERRLLCG